MYILFLLLFFFACVFFLRYENKKYKVKNESLKKSLMIENFTLMDVIRQQQILYDLSTSIFLLDKQQDIIKNVLTELATMYIWKDVAYLPKEACLKTIAINKTPQKSSEEIMTLVSKNIREDKEIRNGNTEYVAYLPVEKNNNLLGILYINNGNFALSQIQINFGKILVRILASALENTQK